jgi:hypothetical protein
VPSVALLVGLVPDIAQREENRGVVAGVLVADAGV